ncbi:hypothetical protein Tco_1469923 [Tanacetum coccineum]
MRNKTTSYMNKWDDPREVVEVVVVRDDFGVELGLMVLEEHPWYHQERDWMVEERVSLEVGVFDSAFGGDGEEDFVMGEGVVVASSLLDKSTKSFLGRIMVSLIFLEGLEKEACMDAIDV